MHELVVKVAELRQLATELKRLIAMAPNGGVELREALYGIDAAVYIMERAAADAYQAV